jgi:hypothetical protein
MAQTPKNDMIKMIESLPDDVTVEDVMYHLYVKETVLQRLKSIDDHKITPISEDEAQDRIQQWLK